MKGILLAGGRGSRLYPLTVGVNKQLLPIHDKPMVYYPLSVLMLAGIRHILIISTPHDTPALSRLLGDGRQWGCRFEYAIQKQPKGIAEAFIVGASFLGKEKVCLILGDNLLHGAALPELLRSCTDPSGGIILATQVQQPQRYGVVFFDEKGRVEKIEEKPPHPTSPYAIPGLYFYDNEVVEAAKTLRPSARGELEITDLHNYYLAKEALAVRVLSRGAVWMDAGTFDSLHRASQYVRLVETRQSLKIGCVEEVALHMGYINKAQLRRLIVPMENSPYGVYLAQLLRHEKH